jgi:hypothetical protein
MKTLLTLEEVGQLLLSIILFGQLHYAWWVFPACILLPDLSMIGYAINSKVGAWIYNLFHHKATAILIYGLGVMSGNELLLLAGIILFGHSTMDRIFGYGLKYPDHFHNTHLGKIGRRK